jgi:nucleoside-diphosphate kinase
VRAVPVPTASVRLNLSSSKQRTLEQMADMCCVVVKSHAVEARREILAALQEAGIACVEIACVDQVPGDLMAAFYAEHVDRPYYERLLASVSGPLVFAVARTDDIGAARRVLGPTDPAAARETAPQSIRARFGTVLPHNAVHLSDSRESAARELALLRAHDIFGDAERAAVASSTE